MTQPAFNRATHFSIVWAVVLAILTLVEWSSLDRDPMSEQIFLPFIERDIDRVMTDVGVTDADSTSKNPQRELQTHVQIGFNGPLFLAYFFGPILIFHAVGLLWSRLRQSA